MKALVLTGSPHAQGTTECLADAFCAGAAVAGHEIVRFATAKMDIQACNGCGHCRKSGGRCVFTDDMEQICQHLLTADAIVLVTPLYFFGMSAQLKASIDRLYAVNSRLRERPVRLLLLAAGTDRDPWAFEALKLHVQTIGRYLHWQDGGMVLAMGASSRKDVEGSEWLAAARELGAGL